MKRRLLAVTTLIILFGLAAPMSACTLLDGVAYFQQVTQLKGRVVGSKGFLQFRWWRRMFSVSGADLDLFPYQGPYKGWDKNRNPVAHVKANASGVFEFGQLKEGHYTLRISTNDFKDWFDVEVTNKVAPTKAITIDVSPITPDCKGGHEFEVTTEKK